MRWVTILLLTILFSSCHCLTPDYQFGARLSEYTFDSIPRLQTQFQAMLFPLFLIGDWQTAYELTIQGTFQRVDYLIRASYQKNQICTIIELKRSGSIDKAVEQAKGYGQKLQNKGICRSNWCAVGINIPANFPEKTIEVKYETNNILGCQHYKGPFKKTIENNRVTFLKIIDFAKSQGPTNDL